MPKVKTAKSWSSRRRFNAVTVPPGKANRGRTIGETGDGYRIKFEGGFVAENVKPDEITDA